MAETGRPLGHKLCLAHSIKELTFICKTCGIPICNICVTSTHKKHDFDNLVNHADLKYGELQDFKTDTITRQIPEIEEADECADNEFHEVVQLIRRNIKNSRDHGEYLRELIAEHMTSTETEYNSMLARYRSDQHKYKSQSEDAVNILEQLIKQSEDAARSKSNIFVVDVAMHIASNKPSLFTYQKPIVKSFVQGYEQGKHIKEAFGCIQESDSGDSKKETSNQQHHGKATKKNTKKQKPSITRILMPEVKQVLAFQDSPTAMVRTNDGTLYICYNGSPQLTKVTEAGFRLEVKCDVKILDISVHPSTDQMYCAPFPGRSVRSLDCETGKSRKHFDIQEYPICLVVTQDNHMIVSERNSPVLHVYNKIGIKVQTLKCEGDPKQVAVCRYSGIVGIAFGNRRGCSVLDNKYQKLYTTKHVLPCDCVGFDGHDHLLLGDYHNKCVYIRNAKTDEHITTITSDNIQGNITCLISQNNGELYVCTSTPHQLLTIKYLCT